MPITSGLIRVRAANDIAAGVIKATAAGLNVPRAVSTEAQKKNNEAQQAYKAGLELEPQGQTASMLRRRVLTDPPT